MSEQIGKYPFIVEPFSEDFAGRLSWRFLGNHLLRCASLHAGSRGFGYDQVNAHRHAWVLSRLVVEMEQMPCTGQHYTVETWVSKIYRQFTDRLFAITADDGSVFGYAHSIWALIDIESRQPIDLTSLPAGGFAEAVSEREVPIKGAGRVRIKSTEPQSKHTACYSDLDINGHVNSIRYIEMVLDLFGKEIHAEGKTVKRVEMAYCAESYMGETLLLFADPSDDGRQQVEIRKESGEVVVKATVELR